MVDSCTNVLPVGPLRRLPINTTWREIKQWLHHHSFGENASLEGVSHRTKKKKNFKMSKGVDITKAILTICNV